MSRVILLSSSVLLAPLLVPPPVLAQEARAPASADVSVRTDSLGRRAVARRGDGDRIEPAVQGLQAPHWRSLGPYGGDIDDVHASPSNPQIVLAGLAPTSGAGGSLKRIAVGGGSTGGASTYPGVGDPSISARSAALGDPFGPGATGYYQTYYRNPAPAFCPSPPGSTFNITNGAQINW